MPAPTSEGRKKCYEARDRYFKCVEESGEDSGACKDVKELYDNNCPASWVKYFARKKVFDAYKEKLKTEGFKPEDQTK